MIERLLSFLYQDVRVIAANIERRLLIAFAALIMWVLFGAIIAVAFCFVPVLMVAYVCTGSAWLYSRVGAFGQALDSCANVPFMDGHPKETISSHAGRYYEAKYGNPYKNRGPTQQDLVIPWQAKLVRWLTDMAEENHVLKAVEEWAITTGVPL